MRHPARLSNILAKTYKKSTDQKANRVDLDTKNIADKLSISDIVDQLQKHDAYEKIKDYKESFPHNPSFRIISSSKSDIGKVNKTILDGKKNQLHLRK